MTPITWQRVESVAIIALIVIGSLEVGFHWWWLLALFLAFDLSALAYLKNPGVGAQLYNAVHNYTLPAVLFGVYLASDVTWLAPVALAWGFHVAVDRALGYGLKFEDNFQHTHLGWIGKKKPADPPQ